MRLKFSSQNLLLPASLEFTRRATATSGIHVYNNKCCIYGTIVEQLHPSEVACSGSFCGACWLYAIVPPPCSWYMHMSVRQAIKRKYGIKPVSAHTQPAAYPRRALASRLNMRFSIVEHLALATRARRASR